MSLDASTTVYGIPILRSLLGVQGAKPPEALGFVISRYMMSTCKYRVNHFLVSYFDLAVYIITCTLQLSCSEVRFVQMNFSLIDT